MAAKRGELNVICRNCQMAFHKSPSHISRVVDLKNHFCTHDCRAQYAFNNSKSSTRNKTGSRHSFRIIAETILKRPLNKGEIVHHIDENPKNNAIDNLAVLPSIRFHYDVHHAGKNFDKYKLSNILLYGETKDIEPEINTCIRGHEFTVANTYYTKTGRGCKTCVNEYHRKRRSRLKAEKIG